MKNFLLSLLVYLLALPLWAQLPPLISGQDYVGPFRFYEQSVNDKVENTAEFASIMDAKIPALYRPETNSAFELATYLVPESELVILNTRNKAPHEFLFEDRGLTRYYRFFVHPVSADAFAPYVVNYGDGGKFSATPLSSYRAILAWPGLPGDKNPQEIINLKVSLDAEIGQSRRMLSRSQIERATAVSYSLKVADLEMLKSKGIYFIDEPFSMYLKKYEFGYTWRELPKLENGSELVPMFSLYAKKNREKSMIQEMIEESGINTRGFLREHILRPMITHMFELAFNEGVVPEPHEQNVLVELKDGKMTNRYYYRDLAGFHFSPDMRAAAGKDMSFVPESFDPESMKTERANVIENLKTYLLESNFYAMRAAVESTSITRQWVEETSFEMVQKEILERTGYRVNEWATAKAALTRWSHKRFCSKVF